MEQIARRSPSCWHCETDVTRNLIPPCKCQDKFIHDFCLKMIANTEGILYCPFCKFRYPLEIRPESLLKMLLKVCNHFFMILLGILIIYIITVRASVLFDYVEFPFIVQIIIVSIFLRHFYTYWPVGDIVDYIIRIYELYRQWYESTYEWKLMIPSTVNNIEEYNIEE